MQAGMHAFRGGSNFSIFAVFCTEVGAGGGVSISVALVEYSMTNPAFFKLSAV